MDIITGYKGTAHISADQIRGQNKGIFGDGSYILNVGNKFNASIVSATSVKLEDGMLSHQGCTAVIAPGTIETLTIGNGTQGMKRIDLIVARYTKDAGTGVEDMELVVIQGTPAASSPSSPAYNEGDIAVGDSPVDMPLFEVNVDGITLDSIVQVAPEIKAIAEIGTTVDTLDVSVDSLDARFPEPTTILRDDSNATNFDFYVTRKSNSSYSYFLMMGGTSATARFLYHGFVNTSANNNTVTLEAIHNTNTGITFTATFLGTLADPNRFRLQIHATATVYGGIRLIWLS